MKVRIGNYDIECSVEEFEKIRKNGDPHPAASTAMAGAGNQQSPKPINGVAQVTVFEPIRTTTPLPVPDKTKIARGAKSLVVGTVAKYGATGLSRSQIQALSGLTREQVRDGIYGAMKEKWGPVLLVEEQQQQGCAPSLFFCTSLGESYAIASDFGKKKLVRNEEYGPKGAA